MDIVMNNLVEHWDKIKDMDMSKEAKATFISCLSPSHYEELVRLRPEVSEIREGVK